MKAIKTLPYNVITGIKRNNKLMEKLSIVEDIMEDIYYNYPEFMIEKFDVSMFEKIENTEITANECIYTILKFVEENQQTLMNESKKMINQN